MLAVAVPLRARQRGLDQFMLPAPPCKDDLTPAVSSDAEYRSGAPVRRSLLDPGMPGVKMTLAGYVTGLTCGRIKGARVDFWQADSQGRFDPRGFRLRGAVLTDGDGRYAIETVIPGEAAGRAKRISARLQPPGKASLSTVLFFPDDPAASKDKQFKPGLVMKRAAGPSAYTFDFLLDA